MTDSSDDGDLVLLLQVVHYQRSLTAAASRCLFSGHTSSHVRLGQLGQLWRQHLLSPTKINGYSYAIAFTLSIIWDV